MSAVGERTYGSIPPAFGADVSSFGPEDLYFGWRSGTALAIGDNAIDLTVGPKASTSSVTACCCTTARQRAGRAAATGRTRARHSNSLRLPGSTPGPHTVEMFYLDKDELPGSDTGSRLWGLNYEFSIGEDEDDDDRRDLHEVVRRSRDAPGRDGLNVFNFRAYTAPIPSAPDLSFEFEYASERNGEALDSNAWTLQGSYELSEVAWKPKLSYRYAFFQGDDPPRQPTRISIRCSPASHDWGTWWQGEIAGEYFLSNSNLKSHLIRAQFEPNDAVSGGLMFYNFTLDHPQALGPTVTDTMRRTSSTPTPTGS